MKKVLFSILTLVFMFLLIDNVKANGNVEISSVEVNAKSENVTASVSSFEKLTFNTKESFFKVGDYVTYKVTLKNNTSTNLPIESISDNLENEYIETSYIFDKVEIKSGEEYSFLATMKYKGEITDNSININFPIEISIKYSNGGETSIGDNKVEETKITMVANPNTKDNFIIYIVLFVISILSIIFLKNKKKKLLVVLIAVALIPTIGHAVNDNVTTNLTANMNNSISIYKKIPILKTGLSVNKTIKEIAGTDTSTASNAGNVVDNNIVHIVRAQQLPSDITLTDKNIISDDSSSTKAYVWFKDGTLYYYADADTFFLNENSVGLFANLSKVEDIDLSIFDTSRVKSFKSFFYDCVSLKSLDLSNFDTSNATNMATMFSKCINLTELNLSSFDTSNVVSMNGMFQGCVNLELLDLSNFNTSNVTNMAGMFLSVDAVGEMKLKEIKGIENFDTSKVTNMEGMFQYCSSLQSLDLSKWITSNVTDMSYMFTHCSKLKELKMDNFDTSNVTSFTFMFGECNSLTKIDVSKFNTSNVTNMRGMFYNCYSVTELDTSNFDTSKVTDMGWMFGATAGKVMKLKKLDLSNYNTSNVIYMDGMFQNCTNLTSLNVSSFDTSKVTTMDYMFCDCSNLTELDVSSFNTSKVTSMKGMFEDCKNLNSLDVTNFDTSNVTNMEYMFTGDEGVWKLTSLDLSSFNTSKVTNMHRMLYNLGNVTVIYASDKFVTTKVTNSKQMFTNDKKLVGGNNTVYDSTKQEKEYARIDKDGEPGYFTAKN